jgi:hypothetical protein
MAVGDVSHAEISRALASLGERAGPAEVAMALRCDFESFEAQMRRRMRTRVPGNRLAYLALARAGEAKVRFHLEVTGVIAHCAEFERRRRPGAAIRVGGPRRRRARRPGHGGAGSPAAPIRVGGRTVSVCGPTRRTQEARRCR